MTEENTKELQVLDEMGQEVRKITKFEQTVESLKEMVAESTKIEVTDLKDKKQLDVVKRSRIDLRDMEIAIEKRGKGYRDVFNAVNKEILAKEKELKEITSPEIERLKKIEAEAKELVIIEERKAKMPARKERLMSIDDSGCYICADEYLLEMDANAFETYYNNCVANKNERSRIALEEKAEADRKAEQARIDAERAELEAEKEAERKRKEKEEEERKEKERQEREKEIGRRRDLMPERLKALSEIGDNVPQLAEVAFLAMDDNAYQKYYNDRVTAKNEADAKQIEYDREKDLEKIVESKKHTYRALMQTFATVEACDKHKNDNEWGSPFELEIWQERRDELEQKELQEAKVKAEEDKKKKALQKREDYIKFLKDNGYTKETSGDFHTEETETTYVLYKKVGVFNK